MLRFYLEFLWIITSPSVKKYFKKYFYVNFILRSSFWLKSLLWILSKYSLLIVGLGPNIRRFSGVDNPNGHNSFAYISGWTGRFIDRINVNSFNTFNFPCKYVLKWFLGQVSDFPTGLPTWTRLVEWGRHRGNGEGNWTKPRGREDQTISKDSNIDEEMRR